MKAIKTTILGLLLAATTVSGAFANGSTNGNPSNATSAIGTTAIGYYNDLIDAVKNNDITAVVVLLDKGMNPNIIEAGNSPLMLASRSGETKMANILVAFGADVNLRNDDGLTALMLASRFGHTEVVDLLLTNGADANLRNKKGYTSADLARMFNHEQTAARLRQDNMR